MLRAKSCFAVVLLSTVFMLCGCTTPASNITEEQFKGLLTVQDIGKVLMSPVELDTKFYDYKKMAESVDPEQVVNMDSFYSLSFQTEDRMNYLTFSVIDFNSRTGAQNQLEKMKSEIQGLKDMAPPIGDVSAEVEVNAQGIGSIIVFTLGDKVISLHTATLEGASLIVNLNGLEELARIVEERI